MAQPPRLVDLRLTIPTGAPFHTVAGELAAKFAEYSGADAGVAENLARAVEVLASKLAAEGANGSIALTMEVRERELTVTGESGSFTEQATIPLH
jgi:hypothetical protein